MLWAIFRGKDDEGRHYGVYLKKRGRRKWDYTISAKLFYGTRTLKDDDIDYMDDSLMSELKKELDEKLDFYKTNLIGRLDRQRRYGRHQNNATAS